MTLSAQSNNVIVMGSNGIASMGARLVASDIHVGALLKEAAYTACNGRMLPSKVDSLGAERDHWSMHDGDDDDDDDDGEHDG